MEAKLWTSFYIFRLASLVLTSGLYALVDPVEGVAIRITTVVLLFIHSHLMLYVYTKTLSTVKKTTYIVLMETLSISLLLVVTGGLASPFIWYALNPIIIASVYLQPLYSWLYLTTYCVVIAVEDLFITARSATLDEFFVGNAVLLLILGLVSLALQILSRVSSILSEQSQMLKQQQDELYSAFSSLSENHHMIQSLSDFQREAVSCRDKKDIEEQNRIANEIHDSVSQNLFSVVYGVDALIKQADSLPLELKSSCFPPFGM